MIIFVPTLMHACVRTAVRRRSVTIPLSAPPPSLFFFSFLATLFLPFFPLEEKFVDTDDACRLKILATTTTLPNNSLPPAPPPCFLSFTSFFNPHHPFPPSRYFLSPSLSFPYPSKHPALIPVSLFLTIRFHARAYTLRLRLGKDARSLFNQRPLSSTWLTPVFGIFVRLGGRAATDRSCAMGMLRDNRFPRTKGSSGQQHRQQHQHHQHQQ